LKGQSQSLNWLSKPVRVHEQHGRLLYRSHSCLSKNITIRPLLLLGFVIEKIAQNAFLVQNETKPYKLIKTERLN